MGGLKLSHDGEGFDWRFFRRSSSGKYQFSVLFFLFCFVLFCFFLLLFGYVYRMHICGL